MYRRPKGLQDIYPPEISLWQKAEEEAKRIFSLYGYKEIRTPVMEYTEVFVRSIGENTDIVEKEMYTFSDRAGRSITLRPEGTAPVVRAYVQNNLYNLPSPQKFYYIGPMFRYERPQRGRYRQFHQIGVELFGEESPEVDAEVLEMLLEYLNRLDIRDKRLEINSIGCKRCRPAYRKALIDFLSDRKEHLCSDCLRRYRLNPLRVLDCKVKGCKEVTKDAPQILDYLCEDCKTHFETLKVLLEEASIEYLINPRMVRGLDYYTKTTFEVTSSALGAQNAIAAGGRYDGLIKEFGGPDLPGIGFAIGMERLTEIIKTQIRDITEPGPIAFFATLGEEAKRFAKRLVKQARDRGLWVERAYRETSLKSQLKRADRLDVKYTVIIGEEEIKRGLLKFRRMSDGHQEEVAPDKLIDLLSS